MSVHFLSKIIINKMAATQALQSKIDILWYKIHQEEVYNSVEMNVKKKIARLENIANLYTELTP